MPENSKTKTRFQILCLSGGGFKGLYTAQVLARIEEKLEGTRIGDHFDLISGTSIGGIIAAAISLRIPMQNVVAAFQEHGPKIFTNCSKFRTSPIRWGRTKSAAFYNLLRNRASYDPTNLKEAIEAILGSSSIKVGDVERPLLIPAINMSTGRIKVFKSPYHLNWTEDQKLPLIDVLLSTSAAPTYFPLHSTAIGQMTDGGLFANAPDLLCLHEFEKFIYPTIADSSFQNSTALENTDLRVLSIGTTESNYSKPLGMPTNAGLGSWMVGVKKKLLLLETLMGAQEQLATQILLHRLGDAKYVRLNQQNSSNISLDDATLEAQELLCALAHTTANNAIDTIEREFLGHQATFQNNRKGYQT